MDGAKSFKNVSERKLIYNQFASSDLPSTLTDVILTPSRTRDMLAAIAFPVWFLHSAQAFSTNIPRQRIIIMLDIFMIDINFNRKILANLFYM
jgi:hypothetical protein